MFVGVDANKKRRGVVRASLTKLRTKLMDLEGDTTIPTLMESARYLADKLELYGRILRLINLLSWTEPTKKML